MVMLFDVISDRNVIHTTVGVLLEVDEFDIFEEVSTIKRHIWSLLEDTFMWEFMLLTLEGSPNDTLDRGQMKIK